MKTHEIIIKKFKEETGYTLKYNDGLYIYGGRLGLRGHQIQFLPDNLTVGGFLDLRCSQIQSLPDNLTVGGGLYLNGTPIQSLPDNLTVGGGLDLEGTQIQSLPDNLTVGDYLGLGGTQIQFLPDNLTVGGSLDLEGTQIQSLPDNLTVGGYLYLEGTQITETSMVNRKFNVKMVDKLWSHSKFIKVDGIFAEKINHHGGVWEVREIADTKTFFIVTDGNGKFAHGQTIQEAKKDLIYKMSNRNRSRYKNLTLDSELSFEEAIECYRVITGACSFGTKDFVENHLIEKKDEYTIQEMIELTRGRYGNRTFEDFFKL